jgi:hypothetical protein
MNIPSIKGLRVFLALVLVSAFTALAAVSPMQSVLAAAGDVQGHTYNVTFTKWVATLPANPPSNAGISMPGVAGGDVGNGRFLGKVLSDDLSVSGFWLGHARYEFYGEGHSLIADVHVTENDTANPATAAITGVVTQGWLGGAQLTGEYTVMPVCPIATPGNVFGTLCFQGTLHILQPNNPWDAQFFQGLDTVNGPGIMKVPGFASVVAFNYWPTGSPTPGVPATNWSMLLTRSTYLSAGDYIFWATADDGALLWVDGDMVINNWSNSPSQTASGTTHTTLVAGQHTITIAYRHVGGPGSLSVSWGVR